MDDLVNLQINASLQLQETKENIEKYIETFTQGLGNAPLVRQCLENLRDACISYGRLELLLENTLKNDSKNTEKEG